MQQLIWLLPLALVVGVAGWGVSDRLERRNDFCVSCHLPDGTPFELSRETCLGCHPTFRHSAAPGWTVQAYHGHPDHEGEASLRCVSCHAVHEEDGDAFAYFMARPRVAARCRECHVDGDGAALPSRGGGSGALR